MMLFGLRTSNTHDAAELSGMAQSVGYLLAAIGPTLFGYLHDERMEDSADCYVHYGGVTVDIWLSFWT